MVISKAIAAIRTRFKGREYSSLSATVETPTGRKNTDAFFAELAAITHQTGSITHAFNDPENGLIGYIQLHRAGGTITIHRIWTVFPKRGYGSKMLRQVCDLADRHQVFIKLKVAPLGRKPYPMSALQLREWYHRHGFRGEKKLIRSPSIL
jgi:RimJ/RimL family protein N-acetyltransferase